MDDITFIYTICSDEQEGKKIAKKLLQKKLCACVNIIPLVHSYFTWPENSDKIEEVDETIVLIKTSKDKFEEVQKEILKIHSYELPCIMALDVNQVEDAYYKWVKRQIS